MLPCLYWAIIYVCALTKYLALIPFPIACWQLWNRDGMQHLGQFSSGCRLRSGLHGSHHAGAGTDPSVLCASHFHDTEESVSPPDFHLCSGRDVESLQRWRLLGWKMQIFFIYIYILFFFFLPLLHVHAVINELEEGWAGRCFCQPK